MKTLHPCKRKVVSTLEGLGPTANFHLRSSYSILSKMVSAEAPRPPILSCPADKRSTLMWLHWAMHRRHDADARPLIRNIAQAVWRRGSKNGPGGPCRTALDHALLSTLEPAFRRTRNRGLGREGAALPLWPGERAERSWLESSCVGRHFPPPPCL